MEAFQSAVSYVIQFNMGGLIRVEESMFMDWLRHQLGNGEVVGKYCQEEEVRGVVDAFWGVLDVVDGYRVELKRIGEELVRYIVLFISCYIHIVF